MTSESASRAGRIGISPPTLAGCLSSGGYATSKATEDATDRLRVRWNVCWGGEGAETKKPKFAKRTWNVPWNQRDRKMGCGSSPAKGEPWLPSLERGPKTRRRPTGAHGTPWGGKGAETRKNQNSQNE